MREDYEPYFQELKKAMDKLGYVSLKETDLDAEFLLNNGWTLVFECERYYGPMFGIFIVAPYRIDLKKISYRVSYVKLAFERLRGACYKNLSTNFIESLIEFLAKEKEVVFGEPYFYDAECNELEKMSVPDINSVKTSHKAGIVTLAATKPADPAQS